MPTPLIEDDLDLKAAWDEAVFSFNRTCKFDLTGGTAKSPGDVIKQIDSQKTKDKAQEAKHKTAKAVITNSLKCIETLGGIVSQGTSMVFGPSTLCFNAVSFLIQAGQNYSNIFAGLSELFSRISDVLERCVVYLEMKEVDLPLKKIINKLFIGFVSICELSVKVLHGNKIIKFIKTLAFNSDDGVQAELANLAILVDKELQMKTTLTYQIGKETKETLTDVKVEVTGMSSALDKIARSETKREADSIAQKQLEIIKKGLGNPGDAHHEAYQSYISSKVDGTGEWLQRDISYISWADRYGPADPIFCISGNEGYGKSYLVSTIINNLQNKYQMAADDVARTPIAFYYFEKDSKSANTTSKEASVDKALKSLAWQFAQADPVYQKDLFNAYKNRPDTNGFNELCDRVLDPCFRSNEMFYIIFDGLDQIDEKQVATLSALFKGMRNRYNLTELSHVRFLISARRPALEDIWPFIEDRAVSIDVAFKNGDDLEIFIKDRLNSIKILKGASDLVKVLREEILDTLTKNANGDFINVEMILNEISTKERSSEVRKVLLDAGEGTSRIATIARAIQRCSESFSDEDISDLNELLTWTICAPFPLYVEEMEAVLFLKNGEPSLRPLYNHIRDQYSAFLDLESNSLRQGGMKVILVSDSIKDYFQDLAISQKTETVEQPMQISEVEVRIVKHFLNTVCPSDLYQRFGFDEFFQRKLKPNPPVIFVNEVTDRVRVLISCLKVMLEAPVPETQVLLPHIAWAIPDYLFDIDLSTVNREDKILVGGYLLKLFTDFEAIKKWWTPDRPYLVNFWIFGDSCTNDALKWLGDPDIINSFSKDERYWVQAILSKSSPEADLLENIAINLGREWLQNEDSLAWATDHAFTGVYGYWTKIQARTDKEIQRATMDPQQLQISANDIHATAGWVAEKLHVVEFDYDWVRIIARTLRDHRQYDEAIKQFNIAMTLSDDNWLAIWGLAIVYDESRQYQRAIDTIKPVFQAIERGDFLHGYTRLKERQLLRDVLWWHQNLDQYDEAFKTYDRLIETDPTDYESAFDKMVLMIERKSYLEAMDFMKQMHSEVNATGVSRLSEAWRELTPHRRYHDSFISCADRCGSLHVLRTYYQAAMDDMNKAMLQPDINPDGKRKFELHSLMLSYYAASTLLADSTSTEQIDDAVSTLQSLIVHPLRSEMPQYYHRSKNRLTTTYYNRLSVLPPEDSEAIKLIDQLRGLAMDLDNISSGGDSSNNANLLLARYYSLHGRNEDARNLLKSRFKLSLDLLSNEDPTDDWQGFMNLGLILMYFGDIDNAKCAWSLFHTGTSVDKVEEVEEVNDEHSVHSDHSSIAEDSQSNRGDNSLSFSDGKDELDNNPVPLLSTKHDEEQTPEQTELLSTEDSPGKTDVQTPSRATSPTPSNEDQSFLPEPIIGFMCDGGCDMDWTTAGNMYLCRDCIRTSLEPNCYELLQKGEFNSYFCNPKHEFLHIPPWNEERRKLLKQGKVLIRDEEMMISDWLEALKEEWGFKELQVENEN